MAEVFGTIVADPQVVNLLGRLCKDAKDVRQALQDVRSHVARLGNPLNSSCLTRDIITTMLACSTSTFRIARKERRKYELC